MNRGGGRGKPSAGGGLSKNTQDLVNQMIKKSNLTHVQRQHLSSQLSCGAALPTSSRPESVGVARAQKPKVAVPRPVKKPVTAPGPSTSISGKGRRTREAIHKAHPPELEVAPPVRTRPAKFANPEMEKRKLQTTMEYSGLSRDELKARMKPRAAAKPKPPAKQSEEELFDSIVKEIDERKQFLEEMRAAGKAGQYETKIMAEIEDRIQDMKMLDAALSK